MPTIFASANVSAGNSRTPLYTAPALTDSIIFSGTISNKDTGGLATHSITVERRLADGVTYVPKLVSVPIAFGGSLKFPKMSLAAGESVYVTGEVDAMLHVDVSVVEKS